MLVALPEALRRSAEAYAGCVAGAMEQQDYLDVIRQAGFTGVAVAKGKGLDIPDEVLDRALPAGDVEKFKASGSRLVSVTIFGEKE